MKRRSRNNGLDEFLVKSLGSIHEMKRAKVADDEEGLFGKQVAASLRRFTAHQKAIAKLKVLQTLTDIEFPPTPN